MISPFIRLNMAWVWVWTLSIATVGEEHWECIIFLVPSIRPYIWVTEWVSEWMSVCVYWIHVLFWTFLLLLLFIWMDAWRKKHCKMDGWIEGRVDKMNEWIEWSEILTSFFLLLVFIWLVHLSCMFFLNIKIFSFKLDSYAVSVWTFISFNRREWMNERKENKCNHLITTPMISSLFVL